MAKKKLHVAMLLDESGSMQTVKDETLIGLNSYIEKLRKEDDGSTRFTLVRFNSKKITFHPEAEKLDKIQVLTSADYQPDSYTPLHDAIGKTVHTLYSRMKNKDTAIVIIITDGLENASKEYNLAAIKSLIAEREATDKWTFLYLGANVDSFAEGAKLGIAIGNTSNYDPNNVVEAFNLSADASKSYRMNAGRRSANYLSNNNS